MAWGARPSGDSEDAEAQTSRQSPTTATAAAAGQGGGLTPAMLSPSEKLTGHQIFYLFILDGIGAMFLSGGINFAVAYAMYRNQDPDTHPIRLFELPNTLAGDAVVTIFIQSIITWLIELFLVNRDLRVGGVQPIGFLPEPQHPLLRRLFFLHNNDDSSNSSPQSSSSSRGVIPRAAGFVGSQVFRALIIALLSFVVLWGPAVGILTAVGERRGGDWYFHPLWAPEIFKLLFGGILALTTPIMAGFWLVRCGWALKRGESRYGEKW